MERNRKRLRNVPDEVMLRMAQKLALRNSTRALPR